MKDRIKPSHSMRNFLISHLSSKNNAKTKWVKVFRIIPEFRILRPTFDRSQPQNAEIGRS